MTHLSEELQHAWMRSAGACSSRAGYLLFSTLGEYFVSRNRLSDDERPVVRGREPRRPVRALVRGRASAARTTRPSTCSESSRPGFDVSAFRPAADDGRHDIYLLREATAATGVT